MTARAEPGGPVVDDPATIALAERLSGLLGELGPGDPSGEAFDVGRALAEALTCDTEDLTRGVDG